MIEGKPGDQRNFLGGIIRGIGKVAGVLPIPGANIIRGVTGLIPGGRTVPRTLTARPTQFSAGEKELGRSLKFGNGDKGCIWPTRRDPRTGTCRIFVGEESGPNGGAPVGDAVMGRYGAALEPGIMSINRATCLRGMHLGNDGLCYNKSQISNKDRMWPRGRRPLLTGGDMSAISTAARAGRRLEGATKRLQRMGMMKKPAPRRALPPGRGLTVKEAGAGSVTVQ